MAGTRKQTKNTLNSPFERNCALFLVILCLLGGCLRLYKLDEKSLWGDELATIASAQGNSINPEAYKLRGEAYDPTTPVQAGPYIQRATLAVSDRPFDCTPTVEVLRQNVHPPLFFCLMHPVIHYFGSQPVPLRIPAVLFGILSIPLFYWVLRRITTPQTALLATAFLTLSAYQVDHAQDARQYTLLTLLALASAGVMLRLLLSPRWYLWTGLTLLTAAGLYTQYFYAPFALFIWGYAAWQRRSDRKFLLKLLLSGMGVMTLFAPWLESFKAQMAFHAQSGHFSENLWKVSALPERLFRSLTAFIAPDSTAIKLIVLGLLMLEGLRHGIARHKGHTLPQSPVMTCALFWIGLTVGGQLLIDVVQQSHTATVKRYLLLAAPGVYLLFAHLLLNLQLSGRFKIIRPVLIMLVLGLVSLNTYKALFIKHHSSDEFRLAAAHITKQQQANDLVIVNKSGTVSLGMAYYLPKAMLMLPIDAQSSHDLKENSPYLPLIHRAMDSHERIWLVFSHEAPSSKAQLTRWMTEQGYAEQAETGFPGVHVYLYQALPD